MSQAAVVMNPTKLDDEESFRKSARRVMSGHGWDEPLWLEPTHEACGGDGTVTACAEGVVGTGVPPAVIPLGAGNLLPRNVSLPMGLDEAPAVAVGRGQQSLDAGRVNGTMLVVMAGLGLDAHMLNGTSEPAKKRLGWFAYAISASRHLGDRPMRMTVSADGGRLDAVVVTARGLTGWLGIAAGIPPRRPACDGIHRVRFTELQITLDRAQPWELEGEVMGSTRQLTVSAQPGALLLRVPSESA